MSQDSWNFACWTPRDRGPDQTRNRWGSVFELGPGAFYNSSTTQPFTDTITAIFSVLIRSGGWTSKDGATQGIGSVGKQGATDCAFRLSTNDLQDPGGRVAINMVGWHEGSTTLRYNLFLGDENGTDWLHYDKWYQVAVSLNAAGMSYAVNGTSTPKKVVDTNSPGTIDMDLDNERIWICGPNAATNVGDAIGALTEWPTMIFGAAAYTPEYIDLTDSAVLNRIYDADGQFKNPGENGSLWFGDTYGDTIPSFYFADGTPIHQTGSDTQKWEGNRGGGAGFGGCPGGLKKQYEEVIPESADWDYLSVAAAEASGDAWLEGDELWINGGGQFIYYAALAVDGHSGLIHKDPFYESGSIAGITVRHSEAKGDPDGWNFTDSSAGTKGVDYEYDTVGSNGRVRQLGTAQADPNHIANTNGTTGDVERFTIIDDLKLDNNSGGTYNAKIYLKVPNAAEDTGMFTGLEWWTGVGSNWVTTVSGFGREDTGVAYGTQQRVWCYYREDRCCIWTDTDTAPSYIGGTIATGFGVTSQVISFNGQEANSTWDMELGYFVNGKLTF